MSSPPLVAPLKYDENGQSFTDYLKTFGGISSTIPGYDHFITETLKLRISTVTTSEGNDIPMTSIRYPGVHAILRCRVDKIDMPMTVESAIGLAPLGSKENKEVPLYPSHCQKYNLNYECLCHLTFYLTRQEDGALLPGEEVQRTIRVPVMVRGKYCWSSLPARAGREARTEGSSLDTPAFASISKEDKIARDLAIGLDPTDPGGYFIIRGSIQNLHYSETLRYGEPLLIPTDPKDKFADVETRFTSPTVQGSSIIRVGYSVTYGKQKSSCVRLNYFNMTNFALGSVKRVPNTVNAFLPYLLFDEFADNMSALYPEIGYDRSDPNKKDRIIQLILKEFELVSHPDEFNRIKSLMIPSLEYLKHDLADPAQIIYDAQLPSNSPITCPPSPREKEGKEGKDEEKSLLPPSQGRGRKKTKVIKDKSAMLAEFIKFLYPHIPFTREERLGKLKLHTMMILSLARYKIGKEELQDRNMWQYKKLDAPGWLMHRLFHMEWRDFLKQIKVNDKLESISQAELDKRISNQFEIAFRNKNWGPYNSKSKKEVNDIAKPDSMAGKFAQLTRVNVQASKHSKTSLPRLVAKDSFPYICPTQTPERDKVGYTKYLAVLAWVSLERSDALGQATTIRKVLSDINGVAFTLEELKEIRKIYTLVPISMGMDIGTRATGAGEPSSTIGTRILFTSKPSPSPSMQDRVMVNGQLLGYCNGPWLQRYLIWLRRFGIPLINPQNGQRISHASSSALRYSFNMNQMLVPFDTMILYQPGNKLLNVKTDNGRLLAPLFTMNEDGTMVKDSVTLTSTITPEQKVHELLRQGAIEYVDAAELHECYVSMRVENIAFKEREAKENALRLEEIQLRLDQVNLSLASPSPVSGEGEARGELLVQKKKLMIQRERLEQIQYILNYRYTHCYISPQQMFSSTVIHAPMGNRQPGPRGLLQANMTKQSLGIFDSMQVSLIETTTKMLAEPVNPNFRTQLHDALSFFRNATGEHKLLRFSPEFGYNQEDASVDKMEYIEGGGMMNIKYHGIRKDLDDPVYERFEDPFAFSLSDREKAKGGGERDGKILMKDGLPIIGAYASMDKFILGIIYENKQLPEAERKRNRSLKLEKLSDQGIVDRVVLDPERKIAKVRIRQVRKPNPGDKFAARYGQKVTSSRQVRDAYLSFITDNDVQRNQIYRENLAQSISLFSLLQSRIPSSLPFSTSFSTLIQDQGRERDRDQGRERGSRETLKEDIEILGKMFDVDLNHVYQEVFLPIYQRVTTSIDTFIATPSTSHLNQILAYEGKYYSLSSSPVTGDEDKAKGSKEDKGKEDKGKEEKEEKDEKTKEEEAKGIFAFENIIEREDEVYRSYFSTKYYQALMDLVKDSDFAIQEKMKNFTYAMANPYSVALMDANFRLARTMEAYQEELDKSQPAGLVKNENGEYVYQEGTIKGSDGGLVADVTVNPLQIVSRVTIGFVCELAITLLSALKVRVENASRYVTTDYETLDWELRNDGYQKYGAMQMASGITGSRYTTPSYIGIIKQESLKHHSADKISARSAPMGSKDNKTHQPSSQGPQSKKTNGQRFGEMERDVGIAHGASGFIRERLNTASDGFPFIYCRQCNYIITEHANLDQYQCRYCGNRDHKNMISAVVPFAVDGYMRNLFYAMNIGMFNKVTPDS